MASASENPKHGPVGTIVVVALVVVLAWQLAHWTWVFLAPPRVAAIPDGDTAPDLAAIAKLFGGSLPAGERTAAGPGGLHLKGVVAPTPGQAASAVFSTGSGKDISVFVGREVQPGMKLIEVKPDHVIVSRAGVQERVDLDAMRSATGPRNSRDTRAAGFRINVARTGSNNYALSRKELDDALRDPNQLGYLGAIGQKPGGGAVIQGAPGGSLAQKLGLEPGDVIKKVNGQVVASPGDLARLYQQFGTLSLVQAEVQRGSATLQISYAIQP
jgi:general secretion pathway protein C